MKHYSYIVRHIHDTCYIHIIRKSQNTNSILCKSFVPHNLLNLNGILSNFQKSEISYHLWPQKITKVFLEKGMCFHWMQRTHRTWAPQAMSVWLHASKNTGYPPRISNRSELKDHFRQVWIWNHSPRGVGVTSKQCFLTLKADDKAINIYLSYKLT